MPTVYALSTPSVALPGQWRADLCGCTAPPGNLNRCCYVTWCTCCAAGDVAQRVGRNYWLDCALACCGAVFIPALNAPVSIHPLVWGLTRQAVRVRAGIPGAYLDDVLTTMFCGCCAIAQELNHLDLELAALVPQPASAGAPAQRSMFTGPYTPVPDADADEPTTAAGAPSALSYEGAIVRLVEMGFSAEAAVQALHAAGGNVDKAAGLLVAGDSKAGGDSNPSVCEQAS